MFNEIEEESLSYTKRCNFLFNSDIVVIFVGTLLYGFSSWYNGVDVGEWMLLYKAQYEPVVLD